MKYQFIKTIFGISLAICTAYSAIRSAYTTVAMPGIANIAERNIESTEPTTEEYADGTDQDQGEGYEYYDGTAQDQGEGYEYYDGTDQDQGEGYEYYGGTDQDQEEGNKYYDGTDQDQGDSDAYYTEPSQGSDQPEVTLADYLAGLRCGACGRNCSLMSPRCRNGMFKAQQAEQEYYEIYGG